MIILIYATSFYRNKMGKLCLKLQFMEYSLYSKELYKNNKENESKSTFPLKEEETTMAWEFNHLVKWNVIL